MGAVNPPQPDGKDEASVWLDKLAGLPELTPLAGGHSGPGHGLEE